MADDDPIDEILRREGEARLKAHAGQASQRLLSNKSERVGIVGEFQFACEFRLPLDWERAKAGGDNGIDFIIPVRFTLDVKTSRNAIHLLVEQGKVKADLYVQAEYSDETGRAELLGWEYAKAVLRAPVKDFGTGIDTHYIHRDNLRKMSDLQQRVMRLV